MAIAINNFTVKATSGSGEYVTEYGTADVTIGRETRTLEAHRHVWQNSITVSGIAVRMGRGSKAWQGELTKWPSGNIAARRSGNYNNPSGRNGISVLGFYDKADSSICLHSGQQIK